MSKVQGECPICKRKLLDGDDVVICPDCGAPYHRECYAKEGHCLFEDKHGAGYEYGTSASYGANGGTQQANAAFAQRVENTGGILCEKCKTVNDSRNIFCEKCGNPLHGQAPNVQQPYQGYSPSAGQYSQPGGNPYMGGAYTDFSGEIDGIPKQDWAQYIGKSAPVYVYRLSTMQHNNGKISFLASAFLLGPLYFAYRKMWGWAALSFVLMLLVEAPQFLFVAAEAGVVMPGFLSLANLEVAVYVASYVALLFRLAMGLFAMGLFRRSAGKKLKALREANSDNQTYYMAVQKSGGTSIPGVVAVVALWLVLYTIYYVSFQDLLVPYALETLPYFKDYLGY